MLRLDFNTIIFLQLLLAVFGYNLSPYPNLVLKQPKQMEAGSYFGYSVLLREKSLLVGAPRASVTEQSTVKSPGAVFKCSFENHRPCEHFPVDIKPNLNVATPKHDSKWWSYKRDSEFMQSEFKNNSYLGATIAGGSKEDDPLLICAPGFSTGNVEKQLKNKNKCRCQAIWGYQGACHWRPKGYVNFMEPFVMNDISKLTEVIKQYKKKKHHLYAQMGFSAHFITDTSLVMGAPGLDEWQGASVLLRDNKLTVLNELTKKSDDSYNGYATSAGYINGSNYEDVTIVETSPRAQTKRKGELNGQAFLLTLDGKLQHVLESKQFGEFFGYSVVVEDVDNDRWDDILIGAPMHVDLNDCKIVNNDNNDKNNCEDVGIVYVYMNTGKDNDVRKQLHFKRKVIRSPFGSKGRFGSSIAKLGDINLDGYNDIAIGAPHANGTGAVAIYLGGENGISTKPSEILRPTDEYRNGMFGFAISKGVDTDGNGYNDLAVGAPLNDTVFYFRSYPVVEIVASIRSSQQLIPLRSKEFEIEFCYRFETQSKKLQIVPIQLNIRLDSVLKRFALSETIFKRNAELRENCEKINATSKSANTREFFEAIPMLLTVTLVNDMKNATEEFCEDCVVLEPLKPIQNKTFYNHGCGAICQVDLSLDANVTRKITLGVDGAVSVGYTVKNIGDRAFDAKLKIESSSHLNFKKSQYCAPIESAVVCDLKQFEQEANQSIYVNVTYEYDVSHFEQINELVLTARVHSAGYERKPEDNIVESVIELHRQSSLELVGNLLQNTIELNSTTLVYDLEYSLMLTNSGPSKVKKADIYITMPYQINDNIFIRTKDTFMIINNDVTNFEPIEVSLLQQEVEPESENSLRAEQELLASKYNVTGAKYQIVNCRTSENTKCMQTHYSMLQTPISEPVSILIKYKFDATYLQKSKTEYWLPMLDATIVVENGKFNEAHTKVKLNPIEIRYMFDRPWPAWIWIVSIVISILLLSLLTWFLAKRGFFKRQTKEQMEERLLQKTEKQRMKEDIDRSLRQTSEEEIHDSMEFVHQEI